MADLAAAVTLLPQVLVNVPAPRDRATSDDVLAAVAAEEAGLMGAGRVLLRPSGTEPLVRVMVEAPTQDRAEQRSLIAPVSARSRQSLTGSSRKTGISRFVFIWYSRYGGNASTARRHHSRFSSPVIWRAT